METQEYSKPCNLGFETTRRARSSDGLKTCLGLFVGRMETSPKWRQAMRTHGTQSVACYVSFRNSCVRDLRQHCRLVQGRYLPDDTVQFRKFDSLVANRGAGEQLITG